MNKKITVNWHLVAFIDVLGQRQQLRNLRGLPDKTDQKKTNDFVELLKKTAGVVEILRELFHDFFESYKKTKTDIVLLTHEQKKLYRRMKCNQLKSHQFSDFVVLSLSLRDDFNKVPMIGVYFVLTSIASTFLTMLSEGLVIRGGIDIGIGLELKNGDLYGSAISRAYEIESKVSQYPRIVLGNELIDYIKSQINIPKDNQFNIMNKKFAEVCFKLIVIDRDGFPILDYLGEGFKSIVTQSLKSEIIEKAYRFVIQNWAKYKSDKNSKLAFRYFLLKNYFESHLHIWIENIEKIKQNTQQTF
jgi:hypothetical protein